MRQCHTSFAVIASQILSDPTYQIDYLVPDGGGNDTLWLSGKRQLASKSHERNNSCTFLVLNLVQEITRVRC